MTNHNLHDAQSSGHGTAACGSLTLPASGAAPALSQSGTLHLPPRHVAAPATAFSGQTESPRPHCPAKSCSTTPLQSPSMSPSKLWPTQGLCLESQGWEIPLGFSKGIWTTLMLSVFPLHQDNRVLKGTRRAWPTPPTGYNSTRLLEGLRFSPSFHCWKSSLPAMEAKLDYVSLGVDVRVVQERRNLVSANR